MSELNKTLSNIRTLFIRSNRLTSESTDAELEEAVSGVLEQADAKPEQSNAPESKPVETVAKSDFDALKQEVETLKQSHTTLSKDLKAVKSDVDTLGKRPKTDAADGEKNIESLEKTVVKEAAWEAMKARHQKKN